MPRTIHKYELSSAGHQAFQFPAGSKILSVQNQYERPVVYVEQEKGECAFQPYQFTLVLTGALVPDSPGDYLGTLMLGHGHYVIHVYVQYPVPVLQVPSNLQVTSHRHV